MPQFLLFCIGGVIGFVVDAGIVQLLVRNFGFNPYGARLLSFLAAATTTWAFNRRYTFRSVENISKAMALVFLYYLVFTPLSTWWGDALTKAGWFDYLVLIGTMLINFVTEYLYQRFVVYRYTVDTNELAKKAEQTGKTAEACKVQEAAPEALQDDAEVAQEV